MAADKSIIEPEYLEPYSTWMTNPNPRNTTLVLKAIQPSIDRAIGAHVGSATPILRSKAKQMALTALKSYDPVRGAKLNTHIVNQLQGLKRVARQQSQVIKIPERVSLDQARSIDAEHELHDMLGRSPSTEELADHTGLSVKRLKYLRQMKNPVAEGQMQSRMDDELSMFSPEVEQAPSHAWPELIYGDLDPINQKILEHSIGLHGQPVLSNTHLAVKLNMTPGAVSQRKQQIQEHLNYGEAHNPLSTVL